MKRENLAPAAGLLVLFGAFLAFFALTDRFTVQGYGPEDDAGVYVRMSQGGENDFWASPYNRHYPWGYPLLLRVVGRFSPSLDALPAVQVGWHVVAVLVFWWGMRQVSASGWLAVGVAAALLFSNPALIYSSGVHSDGVASSAAIATVGLLLGVVRRPTCWPAWLGLTLALFVTYQVRSAYLFLIALVPVLGVLLAALVLPRPDWARLRGRLAAGLVAAAVLPFAAYVAASWVAIREIGLPMMGSSSLLGVTGQFMSEEVIADLPVELRPTLRQFLEARRQAYEQIDLAVRLTDLAAALAAAEPPPDMPLPPGASPVAHLFLWRNPYAWWEDPGAVQDLRGTLRGLREELIRFNLIILLFSEAAADMPGEISGSALAVSWTVIRTHPRAFVDRTARMFALGTLNVFINSYVLHALYAALLVLLGARCLLWIARRARFGDAAPAPRPAPGYDLELAVLFAVAAGFVLASLALLAPVTVPAYRYTDAAGVFLPAVAVVGVFALAGRLGALWAAPRPAGDPGSTAPPVST